MTKERAKEVIRNDKHTLLEGYVTEFLFEKQFLVDREGLSYSKGWWIAKKREILFAFCVRNNKPSELDKRICSHFEKCGIKVFFSLVGDNGDFFFSEVIGGEPQYPMTCEELVKRESLGSREALAASKNVQDEDRIDRCISFFVERNIIKDIARERMFADNFLTSAFDSAINIDSFLEKDEKIYVIEIKFKFETMAGIVGINKGQAAIFSRLIEMGFVIVHSILYNYKRDQSLSIFGFLENTENKKKWYVKTLSKEDLEQKTLVAPPETSVDGKRNQEFIPLRWEDFSPYATLDTTNN